MKYKYTIVWSNKHTNNELVSWLGETLDSMEDANKFAALVAHDLWDEMPSLSWTVFKHLYDWRTSKSEKDEEPF